MLIYTDSRLMAENVRYLRKRKKMSREAFSKYIGMSGNHLYCVERGLVNYIDSECLNSIGEKFGIPTETLLTEDLTEKYKGKRIC